MAPFRTIALGDIHGCVNALDCLLEAIEPRPNDEIIILGDFVDQGKESCLVIDRLIELQERCRLVCLLGNHEEMLLAARDNEEARKYWEVCGGLATLNSYFYRASLEQIPADHFGFIESCRDYYETDSHLFVHASYDPDLPLADTEPHTLRWDLLDPAVIRPHLSGKTAVVGHTEQTKGEVLDLGFVCCIDTACWQYGWLTGLDVTSGQKWQASRFGQLRRPAEPPVGSTSLSHD